MVDVEPDRIRILSSLDGRRARSGRTSRGGVTAARRAPARWWSHVLLGLMGMGLFTVALAVFLIIKSSRDSDLPLTRWDVTNPQAAASVQDPESLLSSQPPGAGLLSEEVAEAEAFGLLHQEPASRVVSPQATENTAAPTVDARTEAAPAATDSTAQVIAEPVTTKTEVKPGAKATATVQASSAKASTSAAASKSASSSASSSASTSSDVRLLEATVLPKHDPRKATKAELFKACLGMVGAEAAICRARICVQHPGVPACQ